jgi:hypothetical protein
VPAAGPGGSALVRSKYSAYDYTVNADRNLRRFGSAESGRQTDVLAGRANSYIRSSADCAAPFFMVLSPTGAHTQGAPSGRDSLPPHRYQDPPFRQVRSKPADWQY